MKRFTFVAVAALAAAVLATPATANMPNGNGHVVIPGLSCEGQQAVAVRVTRNLGGSAWVVETEQHYVVSMFSVTTTFVPANGDPPQVVESFTNTYGNKVGLDPVSCEGSATEVVPGGTLEILIRGEIRFVPPGS